MIDFSDMSDATDMQWLDREDPELQRAWATFKDPVAENHGQTWQYMGTWRKAGQQVHTFRHRCDPANGGERSYRHVPALELGKPKVEPKPYRPLGVPLPDRMRVNPVPRGWDKVDTSV
jgi:hypothetical protein